MSITFSCTGCGRTLKVGDELAGRKAKCPQCQTVLYIPEGPAAAVVEAPAPVGRRAAPVPPPQPEYDDRGDAGAYDEAEATPRRRKKKKSMMLPLLLAGGLVLLLVAGVAVAAFFVLPMIFGGGSSDDLVFMPDGTQMVGQVRWEQITNSDALKQVWTTFPDLKKSFDQASSQSSGVDSNNIDRIYFGAAAMNFSGATPPSAIAVMHAKNAVKLEDVEAGMKKANPNFTFTETKVGKYTMIDVSAPNPGAVVPPVGVKGKPAAPVAPQTQSSFAFAMPDDKRLVIGTAAALQAVLTRDKKPDLNDKLQAAIKATDFNATIAYAVNVKDGFAMPAAQTKSIPLPIDKVDGLSVTIKIATDIDVNVTALCQDAGSAGELSGGLQKAIASGKQQMAKAPPEIAALMDITPQVSGSNVVVTKTIKVAPLLNLAKGQMGGPGFNPFGGLFGR